jgi:hypothetical protein
MNQVRLITISVAFLLLLSCGIALGSIESMGGVLSQTADSGGVAGAIQQYSINNANPTLGDPAGDYNRWLRADALATAYIPATQKGSAHVEITVPDTTKTVSGNLLRPTLTDKDAYSMSLITGGGVSADVKRDTINTGDSGVLSYAYLFADAKLRTQWDHSNTETFTSLGGDAGLDTGIATGYAAPTDALPNHGATFATGVVKGQFTSEAFASGHAGYVASQSIVTATAADEKLYSTEGTVSGTSSLEATNSGKGEIGGDQTAFNGVLTTWTQPAVSFLAADSDVMATGDQNSYAHSGIFVAARRPSGLLGSSAGTSEIFGTASGSMNAASSNGAVTQITDTSATADVTMNADAKAYLSNDDAKTAAYLSSYATIVGNDHDSNDVAFTKAYSKRTTTGTPKAGAETFITNAVWNANTGLDIAGVNPNLDKVGGTSISGKTGSVQGQNGIGAGSFLLAPKNGPAYASFLTQSEASWDSAATETADVSSETHGNMLGPKPAGANTNDGTGIYAAIVNRNQKVDYNTGGTTVPFVPKVLSTAVASETDLMWTDGTNQLAYNGPGYISSGPVYVGGTGTIVGPNTQASSSVVQRQTDTTLTIDNAPV